MNHGKNVIERARYVIITVSDTRTKENDTSGALMIDAVEEASQSVVDRLIVKDEPEEILAAVRSMLEAEPDAIILCGGSGIASRDVTVDTVRPLFDKELPGFGEEFRRRSVEEVGLRGILSGATAGIVGGSVLYCIPGSEGGARTAMGMILELTGHLLWEARR